MSTVKVTIAGYRAVQDAAATWKVKCYMKQHGGFQVHNCIGDAWHWAVEDQKVEDVAAAIEEMYGDMKDIIVAPL